MKATPHDNGTSLLGDAKAGWRFVSHPAIKAVFGLALVLAGVLAGSYLVKPEDVQALRDDVGIRTTIEQVRAELGLHRDEANPHPPMAEQLREVRAVQQTIRDMVIGNSTTLNGIADGLKELRQDVRRIGRDR